jgi:hypothetical protein
MIPWSLSPERYKKGASRKSQYTSMCILLEKIKGGNPTKEPPPLSSKLENNFPYRKLSNR